MELFIQHGEMMNGKRRATASVSLRRGLFGRFNVVRYGNATDRESWAKNEAGFTLIELMIVMTLIVILMSIAVPNYMTAIKRAREAVLRDDLYTMRHMIDEYTVDKQQPPQELEDLVTAGYLSAIPKDPMTGSTQTWKGDIEEVPTFSGQTESGIVNVHSGSSAISLEGTPYSSW